MEVLEVGVREFREKLSEYLLHSGKPVAVTRHGATVGYFIPTRAERGAERLRALREAGAAVDAMLAPKDRGQVSHFSQALHGAMRFASATTPSAS